MYNVGNRRPLYLCILSPGKVDSCQLNLDFEEADEVIFSVIGPLSIHITGYFLPIPTAFRLNDDVQVGNNDNFYPSCKVNVRTSRFLSRSVLGLRILGF